MSQCHNVTMSQCHNITMSQYHNVTISQCRNVTMSPVHRYQQWTASQQCWLHIPSGGKSEPSSKYFHIDPFLTLVCNIAYCNAEDICIFCQLCCRPESPPSPAVLDLPIRSNFDPQQPEIFHLAEDCFLSRDMTAAQCFICFINVLSGWILEIMFPIQGYDGDSMFDDEEEALSDWTESRTMGRNSVQVWN